MASLAALKSHNLRDFVFEIASMTSAGPADPGNDRPSETIQPMTQEQASLLEILSEQAFEPEAFNRTLDRAEAARRIAALQAKLRLQNGPPHTL
jgi:Protein of unknown function (DUF3072)